MKYKTIERTPQLLIIALGLLVLSGCQTTSSGQGGIRGDRAIPGQVARAKYEYIRLAVIDLNKALAGNDINLADIPMDTNLYLELPFLELKAMETAQNAVRRIASTEILTSSDYFLVHVDTLSGRLEYRSRIDKSHVSITVRAPKTGERKKYVVTDIFSQASLKKLVAFLPSRSTLKYTASKSSQKSNGFLKVGLQKGNSDADTLAYFNSLPEIERNRVDLLSLRALLLMRMNQDEKAVPLVEQGIVRYPRSSMYLSLADVLFERKSGTTKAKPDSLTQLMELRFNGKVYAYNRKKINEFLDRR